MKIKVHLSRILGERKMKVAELSRLTGISTYGLHNIYHEKTKAINFDVLNRLCRVLNVQVGDLIEYIPSWIEEDPARGKRSKEE